MTKKKAIFQKKLEEVETQLNEILSLPEDHPNRLLVSNEFEQSLVFVKNLLYAEISSHPSSKSHHFQHFYHKLEHMEAVFRGWDGNFNFSIPDHNTDDDSSCSCTDSCFKDDDNVDDDYEVTANVDPEIVFDWEGFAEDKALVEYKGNLVEKDTEKPIEFLDCLVEEKVDEEKCRFEDDLEKTGVKRAGNGITSILLCKAVTIGIVIGMCLMGWFMVKFSGCFEFEEIRHFPSLT